MTDSRDGLTGVHSVLCTPFTQSGDIDNASLERLVAHQLAWKVDGIVVFGLAGEIYKLTDHDRRRILHTVVKCVDGAVPVIAGTEHTGTEGAVTRTREAVELGASAVMVYPPTFIKPDAAGIVDYFGSIGRAVSVPVIVQDAPAWTGVPLPVELLARLRDASPNVATVKVEAPPAADKIRSLRGAGLSVIGGLGALHLLEDLDAGVQAVMPGSAMPGMYREMWEAHTAGDLQRLWRDFTRALPLLSFQMSSLDTFVAVQKRLLQRIGVLHCDVLRRPGAQLSAGQTRWLDKLLEYTDTSRYLGTPGGASVESPLDPASSSDNDPHAEGRQRP